MPDLPRLPSPPAARVLVADDNGDVIEALRLLLKGEGFAVATAASPGGIRAAIEEQDFDAVLMDLNYARDTTSGHEGLDLLGRIQALDATLPVVVMTAWGSVERAVECMRRGARDYLQKPWDNQRLLATLRTQATTDEVGVRKRIVDQFPKVIPVSALRDFAGIVVAWHQGLVRKCLDRCELFRSSSQAFKQLSLRVGVTIFAIVDELGDKSVTNEIFRLQLLQQGHVAVLRSAPQLRLFLVLLLESQRLFADPPGDDLLQPEYPLEFPLALGHAHTRIAVLIEHTTLGDDRGTVAVHLNPAALKDQVSLHAAHTRSLRDERGDVGVLMELLLPTPAVEVEVNCGFLPVFGHDKHRAGVAHPHVIKRAKNQLYFGSHQLFGSSQVHWTNQH